MIGDANGAVRALTGVARKWDRHDLLYMCTQGKEGKRPSTNSRAFPDQRLVCDAQRLGRAAVRPGQAALVLTAAPYGRPRPPGPAHYLLLCLRTALLWVPSRLNDSSYTMAEHWETLCTWSKNTVVVDGKSQPFGYEPGVDRTCKNVQWFSGRDLDLADATHTMYPESTIAAGCSLFAMTTGS